MKNTQTAPLTSAEIAEINKDIQDGINAFRNAAGDIDAKSAAADKTFCPEDPAACIDGHMSNKLLNQQLQDAAKAETTPATAAVGADGNESEEEGCEDLEAGLKDLEETLGL